MYDRPSSEWSSDPRRLMCEWTWPGAVQVIRGIYLRAHKQAFCWIDEWVDLSEADIVKLQQQVKTALEKVCAKSLLLLLLLAIRCQSHDQALLQRYTEVHRTTTSSPTSTSTTLRARL